MLTEKEALIKCRDMWQELARTGSDDKESAIHGYNTPESFCWCCEYSRQIGENGCSKCPLRSFWKRFGGFCESKDSPYSKWDYAESPSERKHYASLIAKACERRLKVLK